MRGFYTSAHGRASGNCGHCGQNGRNGRGEGGAPRGGMVARGGSLNNFGKGVLLVYLSHIC